MSAKHEFQLKPDRVLIAKMLAVIEIILEPDFGELTRIKREYRRCPRALPAKHFVRVVLAGITIGIFPSKPNHPARLESPKHL